VEDKTRKWVRGAEPGPSREGNQQPGSRFVLFVLGGQREGKRVRTALAWYAIGTGPAAEGGRSFVRMGKRRAKRREREVTRLLGRKRGDRGRGPRESPGAGKPGIHLLVETA